MKCFRKILLKGCKIKIMQEIRYRKFNRKCRKPEAGNKPLNYRQGTNKGVNKEISDYFFKNSCRLPRVREFNIFFCKNR